MDAQVDVRTSVAEEAGAEYVTSRIDAACTGLNVEALSADNFREFSSALIDLSELELEYLTPEQSSRLRSIDIVGVFGRLSGLLKGALDDPESIPDKALSKLVDSLPQLTRNVLADGVNIWEYGSKKSHLVEALRESLESTLVSAYRLVDLCDYYWIRFKAVAQIVDNRYQQGLLGYHPAGDLEEIMRSLSKSSFTEEALLSRFLTCDSGDLGTTSFLSSILNCRENPQALACVLFGENLKRLPIRKYALQAAQATPELLGTVLDAVTRSESEFEAIFSHEEAAAAILECSEIRYQEPPEKSVQAIESFLVTCLELKRFDLVKKILDEVDLTYFSKTLVKIKELLSADNAEQMDRPSLKALKSCYALYVKNDPKALSNLAEVLYAKCEGKKIPNIPARHYDIAEASELLFMGATCLIQNRSAYEDRVGIVRGLMAAAVRHRNQHATNALMHLGRLYKFAETMLKQAWSYDGLGPILKEALRHDSGHIGSTKRLAKNSFGRFLLGVKSFSSKLVKNVLDAMRLIEEEKATK